MSIFNSRQSSRPLEGREGHSAPPRAAGREGGGSGLTGPFPSPEQPPPPATDRTPGPHRQSYLGEVPPRPPTALLTEMRQRAPTWEHARSLPARLASWFVPTHLASACLGAFALAVPLCLSWLALSRSCWLSCPSWLSLGGSILFSDSFTCYLYSFSNLPCPTPPPVSTRAPQAQAGTGWRGGRERG